MKNKEKYSVFISSLIIAFLITILGYTTLNIIDNFNFNDKYQIIYPPNIKYDKKVYSRIDLRKTNVEVKYDEVKDK